MMRRHVVGIIRGHSRWFSVVRNNENGEPWQTPIAEELVSQFGNANIVRKVFQSNPELKQSHIYFWKTFTNALFKFGFQPRDCFRIIQFYPSVLGYEEERLENVLMEWKKQSQLGINDIKFLILNRPEFLSLCTDSVTHRVPFLLNYCTSKELLMTLLFLCPNIMKDDWETIIRKMEFLSEEMVVYRMEVITCRALSKSLAHIKLRFSVIEKCGIYTKPNPYFHKQTQKERIKLNNPKLKDITDKSDYSFARKIAKISLEEYEAYANAFNEYELDTDDDGMSGSSDEE